MAVKNNDSITIDYTLTNTTDSEEVSSGTTWTVHLGRGTFLPGFESGIVGMEVGETKTITLTAANAWGVYDPAYKVEVPSLANELERSGDITSDYPAGSIMPGGRAKIISITGETATLDFNHQLAGKDLSLEITVKKINVINY